VVNPGGTAQTAHRDYHLGFMDLDLAAQFPAHVHRLSPVLTLQGAVAHVDMPVETGPTMYLPHSQKYEPGYMAIGCRSSRSTSTRTTCSCRWRRRRGVLQPRPAARRGHEPDHGRQADGEPAAGLVGVRPGAGHGRHRAGRGGGLPDAARPQGGRRAEKDLHNVVAAAAEGYPFPTNLDRDTPVGSLNPESQAQLVWRALENDWDQETFVAALAAQSERRRSSLAR
jgi:hypothetical protein